MHAVKSLGSLPSSCRIALLLAVLAIVPGLLRAAEIPVAIEKIAPGQGISEHWEALLNDALENVDLEGLAIETVDPGSTSTSSDGFSISGWRLEWDGSDLALSGRFEIRGDFYRDETGKCTDCLSPDPALTDLQKVERALRSFLDETLLEWSVGPIGYFQAEECRVDLRDSSFHFHLDRASLLQKRTLYRLGTLWRLGRAVEAIDPTRFYFEINDRSWPYRSDEEIGFRITQSAPDGVIEACRSSEAKVLTLHFLPRDKGREEPKELIRYPNARTATSSPAGSER